MTEPTCARTRLIGEVGPRRVSRQVAAPRREIPVQEEERRQSLLAVERLKRAVVLELAVNEVQADGLRIIPGDGTAQDTKEIAADLVNFLAAATLCVVTLDQRDL